MKLQRALERIIEDEACGDLGGLAYRKAWLHDETHCVVALSNKSHVFNIYEAGELVGPFIPTKDDVTAKDWVYEL